MAVDTVLKGHDLFRSLSVDENNQLSKFSSVKMMSAGEMVFGFDTAATHVYMLLKGAVDLRLPTGPEDHSFVIQRLAEGELFGVSPLLDSKCYTLSAQCSKNSEILSIEAAPFREMLKQDCPTGFNIINKVAHIYFSRYVGVLKKLQNVVRDIAQG